MSTPAIYSLKTSNIDFESDDEQTGEAQGVTVGQLAMFPSSMIRSHQKNEFNKICRDSLYANDTLNYKLLLKAYFKFLDDSPGISALKTISDHIDFVKTGTEVFLSFVQEKIISEQKAKNRISLFESYVQQKKLYPQVFDGIDASLANLKVKLSLFQLTDFNPQSIKAEITYDKSFFYTLQFGSTSVFYDVFFDNKEDEPEVVFIAYRGEKCIATAQGTMLDCFLKLKKILPALS